MQSGLVWAGLFFAVLGAWYALDTAAATSRWSLRKLDLLRRVLSEAGYRRFTRAVGVASIAFGCALIILGLARAD